MASAFASLSRSPTPDFPIDDDFNQDSPQPNQTKRAPSPFKPPTPLAQKKARYLGDSDDDDDDNNNQGPDLNDIFADIDNDFDNGGGGDPTLGNDPEQDPTTKEQQGDDDQDQDQESEKKKRKPLPKIDEDRLLDSKKGIPFLKQEMRKLEFKGKGHEMENLNLLMSTYRVWAHQMFPKGQFRDTIERVEKICHKRIMQSQLKSWDAEDARQREKDADPFSLPDSIDFGQELTRPEDNFETNNRNSNNDNNEVDDQDIPQDVLDELEYEQYEAQTNNQNKNQNRLFKDVDEEEDNEEEEEEVPPEVLAEIEQETYKIPTPTILSNKASSNSKLFADDDDDDDIEAELVSRELHPN